MKTCDECKWAEWKRTKTGQLHPDKFGLCRYPYEAPKLPNSMYWTWTYSKIIIPDGGCIERGREYKDHCVYWEEAK